MLTNVKSLMRMWHKLKSLFFFLKIKEKFEVLFCFSWRHAGNFNGNFNLFLRNGRGTKTIFHRKLRKKKRNYFHLFCRKSFFESFEFWFKKNTIRIQWVSLQNIFNKKLWRKPKQVLIADTTFKVKVCLCCCFFVTH